MADSRVPAADDSVEYLINSHILSTQQLLQILEERKIYPDRLKSLCKEELVALYNKYCLPLAQREATKCSRKRPHSNSNGNGNSVPEAITSKLRNTRIGSPSRSPCPSPREEITVKRKASPQLCEMKNINTEFNLKRRRVYIKYP